MSTESTPRYSVALQGFSGFERTTLAAFFRLAARRTPSYVEVDDLERCDFVIADADHAPSMRAVVDAGRARDAVFVGAAAPAGAMAWLPRPIDPMHILRELDSLVEQRHSSPGELSAALAQFEGREGALPTFADPAAPMPPAAGADVLVAEDSAIARRFLQLRLLQCGYRVHLAANGEEAMAALRAQPFALVFLDVLLGAPGSLDGLAICRHVKQHPEFEGARPKVVLVTGLSGSMDKVRGSLAGCDAYLTKPLSEEELAQALRTLDADFARREKAAGRGR
ncbi:MAG TPA: response regulator [Albitalea sp.]|nr:response regulator [Albitalea sp.]